MTRRTCFTSAFLALLISSMGGLGWVMAREGSPVTSPQESQGALLPGAPRTSPPPPNRPAGDAPRVQTALTKHSGEAVTLACQTCHATRAPNPQRGQAGDVPTEFHQGLHYAHGSQSCLNCHKAGNYDALQLAHGAEVPFAQAQQLCAQCHGPQTRDYAHGSHGGMNGHWDPARGPRTRNTCTDCHDPHAPAFPAFRPVFAPVDRGARQQAAREAHPAADPAHGHP